MGKLDPGTLASHAEAIIAKLEDANGEVRTAVVETMAAVTAMAVMMWRGDGNGGDDGGMVCDDLAAIYVAAIMVLMTVVVVCDDVALMNVAVMM